VNDEENLYRMLLEMHEVRDRLRACDAEPAAIGEAEASIANMTARLHRIAAMMDRDPVALAKALEPDQVTAAVAQKAPHEQSVRAARLRLLLHPETIARALAIRLQSGCTEH
jgi:hypothetical protein